MEKSGNTYPAGSDFAALIDWHLDFGTRPEGGPEQAGERWNNKRFATAVGGVNERTVRNWRNGASRPTELGSIERELFGKNAAYAKWRTDLRDAYDGRAAGQPTVDDNPNMLGRDKELAEVVDLLLGGTTPIVIPGGPGMGKTTLARAAAHHDAVKQHWPAHHFIELDAVNETAGILTAVARALDTSATGSAEDVLGGITARCGAVPALVILDNAETPLNADRKGATETYRRLGRVKGLTALITCRDEPPDLRIGRQVKDVPPLDDASAREFFLRVKDNRIYESDPTLDALLAEMQGHPLSLELLAGAADGYANVGSLLDDWRKRRGKLFARGAKFGRLESTRVSLDLSFDSPHCTDAALRLVSLVALLPGGIAQGDLETVMPGDGDEAARTLARMNLAFWRDGRLHMLAPLRECVGEDHPARADDRDRLLDHVLALAALGKAIGTSRWAAVAAQVTAEVVNFDAVALAALAANRTPADLWPALYGLAEINRLAALGSVSVLTRAAEAAHRLGDSLCEANCILSLGDIALRRSDHEGARARYEAALPLYRTVGSVLGEANCVQRLGDIALGRSDHEGARTRYETALPLYRTVGGVLGEANCIKNLGDIALRRSDHEGARARYETALPLYRTVGDVLGEANCAKRLGDIALERSDHDIARTQYDEALPLYRTIGDVLGEATCILGLGNIALGRSDHQGARARYEESLPLFRKVGDVLGEASCIQRFGDVALRRSDHEGARTRYEAALPLFRTVGDVLGEANCIQSLGDIALARSDHEGARTRYEAALALYGRIPEPYSIGHAHGRLNWIARDDAERARHRAAAREAWESINRPDLVEEFLGGA